MQSNCDSHCDRREEVTCAGFWVRLAAYVTDSVIVFFGLLFVRLCLSGVLSLTEGTALGGNILFDYSLKDIILYGFEVLYFVLFLYFTGTTPGKKLLNLRVVSADEETLTLVDVVYRETIGRFLCGLTFGIGYVLAGVDKEKRGLHDMLCDTRVIYAKKVKVYPVFQGPPNIQAPFVPRQVEPSPPKMQTSSTPQMPQMESLQGQPGQMSEGVPSGEPKGSYRMVRPEEENEERDS